MRLKGRMRRSIRISLRATLVQIKSIGEQFRPRLVRGFAILLHPSVIRLRRASSHTCLAQSMIKSLPLSDGNKISA